MDTCGYCGGRGWILGSMYGRDGRKDHDEPPRIVCEYCGGAGYCEEGEKLLPAMPPRKEAASTGLPTWT